MFHYLQICDKSVQSEKHPREVVYKKDVPKNYAKLTGKHMCHSLLQIYQKETLAQGFFRKLYEI